MLQYSKEVITLEIVYLAGGCLWGTQAFFKTIPGVVMTEAGRANGTTNHLEEPYDGYAECVKVEFNPQQVTIKDLMGYLFEIIDPYSLNRQGPDIGEKYRTGLYSKDQSHFDEAQAFINDRNDADRIMVEVKPLTNYVKSAEEHQDHLYKYPEDQYLCHVPKSLLNKYKK